MNGESCGAGTLSWSTTQRHTKSVERQLYRMFVVPLRFGGEYQPTCSEDVMLGAIKDSGEEVGAARGEAATFKTNRISQGNAAIMHITMAGYQKAECLREGRDIELELQRTTLRN